MKRPTHPVPALQPPEKYETNVLFAFGRLNKTFIFKRHIPVNRTFAKLEVPRTFHFFFKPFLNAKSENTSPVGIGRLKITFFN